MNTIQEIRIENENLNDMCSDKLYIDLSDIGVKTTLTTDEVIFYKIDSRGFLRGYFHANSDIFGLGSNQFTTYRKEYDSGIIDENITLTLYTMDSNGILSSFMLVAFINGQLHYATKLKPKPNESFTNRQEFNKIKENLKNNQELQKQKMFVWLLQNIDDETKLRFYDKFFNADNIIETILSSIGDENEQN